MSRTDIQIEVLTIRALQIIITYIDASRELSSVLVVDLIYNVVIVVCKSWPNINIIDSADKN